jgi:hypothetical protein
MAHRHSDDKPCLGLVVTLNIIYTAFTVLVATVVGAE